MKIPLFPLNSVICPGGRIPLQLFEPRYLDMLSRCMRDDSGFAIVLLEQGEEVAGQCRFYTVGTMVKMVDFAKLPNGLLGVTVEGQSIVRIKDFDQQDDKLFVGDVTAFPDEAYVAVGEDFDALQDILRALLQHPVVRDLNMSIDVDDARHLSWRLTELLPLPKIEKQRLLECTDPTTRLSLITDLLATIE